jgi:nitrite reductase (NO-forming)
MPEWVRTKLAEWYILIIGIVVIVTMAVVASYDPQPSAATVQQTAIAAPKTPPPTEAQHTQAAAASTSTLSTSASNQGRAAAPHDHTATAPQQTVAVTSQPSRQTAQTSATNIAENFSAVTMAQNTQTVAAPAAGSAVAGDAATGKQVFRKCQACHSMEPGKNLLGPSLAGVINRKAGTEAAYDYSPAMKQANVTWDVGTLNSYLADPQKVVPGNKMPFPGLKTESDRTNVIAYLSSAAAAGSVSTQGATPAQTGAATPSPQGPTGADIGYVADARYTLRSGIAEGRMVYIGVGGTIDGKVNPILTAAEGQVVQLTLINGEGAEHDIVFPDQDAKSPRVYGKGASTTIAIRASKAGDFIYFCSVPGHQLAGMQGQFIVAARPPAETLVEADISREPADLPPPIGKREPQTVRVDLLSFELEGRLAENTTFGYWTFNGKVPGPFIRVRVGDTIDIHLKNSAESSMIHSVDFHAATGPGGGAAALQVDPGQERSMSWKAMVPGLFVYHCATPMVAEHIANGMYGLILVEPEGGLPPVDHEFYVMQGEIYTDAPHGQHGSQEFSVEKLLNEKPEYFVFNGAVGALSKLHPMRAKVGETVRIFFGVGGPNFTSSFHLIGEIFDRVYSLGGVKTEPLQGIQTVTVPAGGAVIVDFKVDVPGNYTLVDHALARVEKGLSGILNVEGPPNEEIFKGQVMPGMGH